MPGRRGRPAARRHLYRRRAVGRAAALVITAVSAQRVTYRYDPTAASHGAQLR